VYELVATLFEVVPRTSFAVCASSAREQLRSTMGAKTNFVGGNVESFAHTMGTQLVNKSNALKARVSF
jgi:hypothetical protein